MATFSKCTTVQTVTVEGVGKLTYLHTVPYDYSQQQLDNDFRWNYVVTMMLTFDKVVHPGSFWEALASRLPSWMNERKLVTDVCILLPIRYDTPIVDMAGFLNYWANRIANAYREVRCQRNDWPKGIATASGMRAFRTWCGKVYMFINAPAYDEFGSNKLVHLLDVSEVQYNGILSAEELAALPMVTLPPNFFD